MPRVRDRNWRAVRGDREQIDVVAPPLAFPRALRKAWVPAFQLRLMRFGHDRFFAGRWTL